MSEDGCVSMTGPEFVCRLVEECPDTGEVVEEHHRDHGESLLHLLIADIRRFSIAAFSAGETEVLDQCLDVVCAGLTDVDSTLENAIAVSFIENAGWWDDSMHDFISRWPEPMKHEVERQRRWTTEPS